MSKGLEIEKREFEKREFEKGQYLERSRQENINSQNKQSEFAKQEEIRKHQAYLKYQREQRQKNSIAGRGNDALTNTIRIAEDTVGVFKDFAKDIKKMSHISREQKTGQKIEKKTVSECRSDIIRASMNVENLRQLSFELKKIDEKLVTCKDKDLIYKLKGEKENIEKTISKNYEINRDTLTPMHDQIYKSEISRHISELSKDEQIARNSLEYFKEYFKSKRDLNAFEACVKDKGQSDLDTQTLTQKHGRIR